MSKPQRRLLTPLVYRVGEDISPEKYQEILVAVTDWFAQIRKTDEPAALARKSLQECLDGKKTDGTPWFEAASSTFAARVKSKCRFDIEAMQPLLNASDRQRDKKKRERELAARKRATRPSDQFIPKELVEEQQRLGVKNVSYGDDPTVLLSTKEKRKWQELYDSYLTQFPELSGVNSQSELRQLCDVQILNERYRLQMLSGQRVDVKDRATVGQDIERLKKALGIHPDQLIKRSQDKIETSIGAVAAKLDIDQWRTMRQRFWIEELLQFYMMYNQPRADGVGYQMDQVGLHGVTKCRTCICPTCKTRNFVGIKIEEIEEYLLQQGALEPLPEDAAPTRALPVLERAPDEGTSEADDAVAE